MDAEAFRDRIRDWRMQAELTQEELDEACGFSPGMVGRLERGEDVKLTDERLAAIIICTERDLLWTLAESFGALFKRLQPLETPLRQRLGKGPPQGPQDEDEELEKALTSMLAGAKVVLRKQAHASDRRALMIDFLLEAAARGTQSVQSGRKRVRGRRKQTFPAVTWDPQQAIQDLQRLVSNLEWTIQDLQRLVPSLEHPVQGLE
jgi:transcriptional regulator with XRE-family HTH domain